MQSALLDVEKWSHKWGFKFSVEKTKYIFFTNKRANINLKLQLYDKELEQVKVIRFLGMWFDTRVTWSTHISKMEEKCKKILNVMRCISGREWGADRRSLKTIYSTMIRAILDYGCIAYGSASKTQLGRLEKIHSQALRICCGAFPSSPVAGLQVEMGELPVHLRRMQLLLTYWAGLIGQRDSHPIKGLLEASWEQGKKQVNSFGWIIMDVVRELELNEYEVIPTVILPATPLWILPQPVIDFILLEKRQVKAQGLQEAELTKEYIGNNYKQYIQVYTDASKDPNGQVGIAYTIPRLKVSGKKRISNQVSVFTGELVAIMIAVNTVYEIGLNKALICTDSSSALLCLDAQQSESRQDIVLEILQLLYMIHQEKKVVQFLWVPAHTGVAGNEEADQLAKQAAAKEGIDMQILYSKSELKSIIKKKITEKWQSYWDKEQKGRHLYSIQSLVSKGRNSRGSRKEDCVLSRLRLGHTGLNATLNIIGKHPTGLCDWCGVRETVEHVLIQCNKYAEDRRKLIEKLQKKGVQHLTLKELLNPVGSDNLLVIFLKRTQLIHRI
ncbi:putative RNA-directed DNA polymerase from transposon BS [Labeo rohita]|uniref:ribonuclease H n=1 Tax=Labeo rohita TaxID=84645 RepID=A0ABQ8L2A7_LABRO|nr:putative RNA-directed DNA polymerase from transposon BS [Labeo rohita]